MTAFPGRRGTAVGREDRCATPPAMGPPAWPPATGPPARLPATGPPARLPATGPPARLPVTGSPAGPSALLVRPPWFPLRATIPPTDTNLPHVEQPHPRRTNAIATYLFATNMFATFEG
ncbi:hypothetical protein FNV65_49030 [Streptomyces sp. S1A1-8]|nr:hypothetical protein FNV58_50440 [Streptomyces sp. RLB1-9]QDO24784.1 hypothetical protein FNV65_49030 [Streptomyces sp. S1A1-8]QDO34904.1 hypothetical protein FNV63_49045 [Streptomyces sp. S1A1-3]